MMPVVAVGVRRADGQPRPRRSLCRLLVALALAVGLVAAGATTASAHAYLLSSNPGSGQILSTAPRQAVLVFSVPVTVRLSTVDLLDATGRRVPGVTLPTQGGNSNQVVVDFPPLSKGAYRIAYEVWDSIDLHESGGAIDFGIGEAAALSAQSSVAAQPSYLETGTRWLELAGIALLIGILAVWMAILPALRRALQSDELVRLHAAARRILPALAVAGYAMIAAGKVGQLAVAAVALGSNAGAPLGEVVDTILLGSRFGQLWLAGMALAIAAVVPARAALGARRRSRWAEAALVVSVLGLIAVYAQSSHGGSESGFALGQIVFRSVHLAAAGVWVGGLSVLAVLLVLTLRGGRIGTTAAIAALRQFGGLALIAVAVLTASGLVLAGAGVWSPNALVSTTYGWTLIAKVLAVVVALGLGLRHNRLFNLSRPANGHVLGGSLVFEVGTMLIVLWGAAALEATAPASTPPPRSQQVSAPALAADTTQQTGDLVVHTSMVPDYPGPNSLTLQLHGDASLPFRTVTNVQVTLSQTGHAPQTVTGTFLGHGRYTFPEVQVAQSGEMAVIIVVTRAPGPPAQLQFAWPVGAAPPPLARLGLPVDPWARELDALAGLVGLVLGAGLLAALIRRRRQARLSRATASP